jgi:integrase
MHYFTGTADQALAEWYRVKGDLLEGRTPAPRPGDTISVGDLCNRFLDAKKSKLATGELSTRSWLSYFSTCQRIIRELGRGRAAAAITINDWATLRASIAMTRGPVALGTEIQRIRTIWKWGYESDLLEVPMRFGPDFRKPSKKALRLAEAEVGPKLLEAAELNKIIDAADVHIRAMIYLGINCGYGNSDCGTLPLDKIDLENGWATYHRPKTGITRRCPLWPETIVALRESLAKRPRPKVEAAEKLLFVTRCGGGWAKQADDNPITKEMVKLLKDHGLHRPGLGFYVLRHTFRTIADAAKDQPAADYIMGHADDSMAANYRQHIDDERLEAVVNVVRSWLLAARKPVKRRMLVIRKRKGVKS